MSLDKEELKQHILDYLEKNRRLSLATSENNIPWAATVFFAYDPSLNIYFISRPETRKTQNIKKNPLVAVAINEYVHRKGYTIGLQIEGKAVMLDKGKDKKQLELYRNRHDWAGKYLHNHQLYKIVPSSIYYLNDELFGPGGSEELKL